MTSYTNTRPLTTGPATGITGGTGTICETNVYDAGDFLVTSFLIDLTGLRSTAADDVIGVDGTSNDCYIGRITANECGTILAAKVTCYEAPGGGDPDINVYASTSSTASESDDATALAGTGILVNTGDHTLGAVNIFTAFPADGEYIYLAAGAATDADYTGGKLLIEMYGYK